MVPKLTARQKLHGLLQKESLYDLPYDEFDKQFSSEGARKELYTGMVEEGLYSKPIEDFEQQFWGDLKKKDQSGSASESTLVQLSPDQIDALNKTNPDVPRGADHQPVEDFSDNPLAQQIEASRQENIDQGGLKLDVETSLKTPEVKMFPESKGVKDVIQSTLSEALNKGVDKSAKQADKGVAFNKLLKESSVKPLPDKLSETDLKLNRQKVADDAAARERFMDSIDNGVSRSEHAVGTFDKTVIQSLAAIPKGVETMYNWVSEAGRNLDVSLGIKSEDTPDRYKSTVLNKLGDSVQGWAEEFFLSNPKYQEEFVSSVLPQALGSMVAIGLTGGSGEAAALPAIERSVMGRVADQFAKTVLTKPVLAGSLIMGQSGFEQAKAAGASDDQAFEVFIRDGLAGGSEGIPVMNALNRMNKASGNGVANWLKSHALGKIKGGSEEMLQEVFQGMMQNTTAAEYYDKTRLIFDGIFRDGAAGFVSGALFSGALHLVGDNGTPEQKSKLKDYLKEKQNDLFQKYGIDPAEQSKEVKKEIGLADGNSEVSSAPISEDVGGRVEKVEESAPGVVLAQEQINAESETPIEEVPQGNIQGASPAESDIQQPAESGVEISNQTQQGINYESEITKRLPDSLSPTEKQGALRGGEVNAEATIISSAVHRAIRETEGGGKNLFSRIKSEEESSLKNYAQEKGVWIEDKFGEPDTNGVEQDVYYNDNGTVTKVNFNVTHDSWADFFDRIAIHNSLFPDAAYTLKGFTDHNDLFSAVLEQPVIQKGGKVTFSDVKNELSKMGFEPVGNSKKLTQETVFENKDTGVELSDLHGENVIKGTDGKIYFIDPIIKKNGGQGIPNENQQPASDRAGEEPAIAEVEQEKPSDKGVVGENYNEEQPVQFEWLGSKKTGSVIGFIPKKGKYRVQDSSGIFYLIDPSELSKNNIKSPSATSKASDVVTSLSNTVKKNESDIAKIKKGGIATFNPLKAVLWPIKQGFILWNKRQNSITEFSKYNFRSVEDWFAKKVNKGLESQSMAIREASKTAQGLFKGVSYTQGDLKNFNDYNTAKKYGNYLVKIFGEDAYKIVGTDIQSLLDVHRALDPETWMDQTQEGSVLKNERESIKKRISGLRDKLTSLKNNSPDDIVSIDTVENEISDTEDTYYDHLNSITEYLDRYKKTVVDGLNSQQKALYDLLVDANSKIHEWYHDRGLLDDWTYQKNKGKYIARIYEEFAIGEDPENEYQSLSSKVDLGMFKQRDEFHRDDLIRDPVFLTSDRMAKMLQTQAVFDYADAINKSKEIQVSDTEFAGSKQLGTPGKPYYGSLTGKYVPAYIAEDFKGFFFMNKHVQKSYEVVRAYDKHWIRQMVKMGHTVWNPVTVIGNIIGNYPFAFGLGIDPITFKMNQIRAKQEIKNNGKWYEEAMKYGVSMGNDIYVPDINTPTKLQPKTTVKTGINKILDKGKKIIDKTVDYYGAIDDRAKLSAYISLREDYGYSIEKSVEMVNESFQNYSMVGKYFDFAAKTPFIGNPYIKFKPDSLRILKNQITRRPLTYVAYYGLIKLISNLMSDASDEDEDIKKIRENRPYIPKTLTIFGRQPGVMQTPVGEIQTARLLSAYYAYDIGDNNDILKDITSYLPIQLEFSHTSTTKEGETIQPSLGDPLLGPIVQALVLDKDFRGLSIQDPGGKPWHSRETNKMKRLLNAINYIARSEVPIITRIEDFNAAINGEPDTYGRYRTITQSILNNFIKIQQFDSKQAAEVVSKDIDYHIEKIRSEFREIGIEKNAINGDIIKIQLSPSTEEQKQIQIQKKRDLFYERATDRIENIGKLLDYVVDKNKVFNNIDWNTIIKEEEERLNKEKEDFNNYN